MLPSELSSRTGNKGVVSYGTVRGFILKKEIINSLEDFIEDDYHKGIHDKIVKDLVKRLEASGLYEVIKHNIPYFNKYRNEYGEADIIARAGKKYVIVEVKSTFSHYRKAYTQLEKDERLIKDYFTRECKIYKFHAFSKGKGELVRIKRVQ